MIANDLYFESVFPFGYCLSYFIIKIFFLMGFELATFRSRVRRSRQGGGEEFSSPELTFCAVSYSVSFPPTTHPTPGRVLPQWHIKDPGHSAKSAGGRYVTAEHAYTL